MRKIAIITLGLLLCLVTVSAQDRPAKTSLGSAYVPLDSWVYPAMDRLAAFGYLPTQFAGQRPWTRRECARLVKQAQELLRTSNDGDEQAVALVSALRSEFAEELGGRERALNLESLYTCFTGIAGEPLVDGYHFGQTIVNDFGRPYGQGANAVAGVSGRANWGPLVAYARGEYQHAAPLPGFSESARSAIAAADGVPYWPAPSRSDVNRFRLLDAYVGVNFKSWQLSFGKQSLWWGVGSGSAFLLSDNAEPIPMLRLDQTEPMKLPSILGWLGPMRIQSFWGQLQGHQFVRTRLDGTTQRYVAPIRPHPYIHGEKISFKPTANLEFGVSATTVFGGPGYPLTWHNLWRSYGLNGSGVATGTADDPGDHRTGFDFTYRIPGLRNWLTLYNDSMAEDEMSPIAYPRRSAMNPGVYLSHVPGVPKLDLRVEGGYTDLPGLRGRGYWYANGQYQSGYTNNGNVMGSWLGRQGRGVQFESTYWISPVSRVSVNYRHMRTSPDFLQGGSLDDFRTKWDTRLRNDLYISAMLGCGAWNMPVMASTTRRTFTSSFELRFSPLTAK